MTFLLDIGGEGRHAGAWNLNPSPHKTLGPERGAPIPRLIRGRADAIPLPAASVDRIIVERTPLTMAALREVSRVIRSGGTVVLRHARVPGHDPHATAKRVFQAPWRHRRTNLAGAWVEETEFCFPADSIALPAARVDNQMPLGQARRPSAGRAGAVA